MTLPRSKNLIRQYTRHEAADRAVAKAGNDKLQVDERVKSAAAAAYQAALDANAAGQAAGTASDEAQAAASAAADAAAAAALGELAYNGELAGVGVLPSQYQDHGVGDNILKYRDVTLNWRPYGWYLYNATTPYTDNIEVTYDTILERDTLTFRAAPSAFNSLGYLAITTPTQFKNTTPYIYSIFCRTLVRPATVTLQAQEYATLTDANSGINAVATYDSGDIVLLADSRYRLSFGFTPGTSSYLVLRMRVKRSGGFAGVQQTANVYNAMLEEVLAGQTKPSKFVIPEPKRGDIPTNAIESNTLKGFIWGLGLQRSGTLAYTIDAGGAYVPGVDRVVPYPGGSATLGSGSARVVYVYLESNADGSAGTIVTSNTAPDVPYLGSARTFPGNPMQRFIGVLVCYSSNIARFQDAGGSTSVYFTFQDDKNLRIVSTGSPLSSSNVSLAGLMPSISRQADIEGIAALSTASSLYIGPAGTATGSAVGVLRAQVGPSSGRSLVRGMVQTDASQNISHAVTDGATVVSLAMMGFWYER